MSILTDNGYVHDRNIEDCFVWLNDNLRLTPIEEHLLTYGRMPNEDELRKYDDRGKLTDKEKKYIIENYKKMANYKMAKELHRSEMTIAKFANEIGLKKEEIKRTGRLTSNQIMYIRENHNTKSYRKMAEDLNIGYMTVYRAVKKLGLITQKGSVNERIMKLNKTEVAILELMANGKNDFEIANEMKLAAYYIRNCVKSIYKKLNINEFSYPVRRVRAVLAFQNQEI